MGTEADRMATLEAKMDKMHDVFQQMVTNQELMQQELKIMNVTLTKVDNLHLQLTACSTSCKNNIDYLQKEMNIHLKACEKHKEDIMEKFRVRDRIGLYILGGTILTIIGTIISHITKGGA